MIVIVIYWKEVRCKTKENDDDEAIDRCDIVRQ